MSKYKTKDISSSEYDTKRLLVFRPDHNITVGEIFWNALDKTYKFYALSKSNFSVEDLKEIIGLINSLQEELIPDKR